MDAQKKKMIFLLSIIGVVVVAVIIMVIGQLTGSFQIFEIDLKPSTPSQSNSSNPTTSAVYESTDSILIGGNESNTFDASTNIQAKSDDYYIELAKQNPVKITKEAYEQTLIRENQGNSLTYDQVVAIIGGEGTEVDTTSDNSEIYMWTTADNTGYAKLTFENGVLTGRAQWGLK